MINKSPLFQRRTAGVLLHPTSLPCHEAHPNGHLNGIVNKHFGTLGREAYRFVDFIAEAGFSVWQMLPVGPTQADLSPYQSISAHAGNPSLISIDWLIEQEWVDRQAVSASEQEAGESVLARAAKSFYENLSGSHSEAVRQAFHAFCEEQAYWLDDFSLFSSVRLASNLTSWVNWPDELRLHKPTALDAVRIELKEQIDQTLFEQFAFFSQWKALKSYANHKGISLFGDIPIFVGHDSADVWAAQHYFKLDAAGQPQVVTGVPPDYFSETGQRWGHPHYDWEKMKADGFQWWLDRLKTQLYFFDLIRVDHFRGFEAYWEIPAHSQDAREGHWVKVPGNEFLQACFDAFPQLILVAENLGMITDEVEALRQAFKLPGMLVLQFAFDGSAENPHLPHHHRRDDVIYTGTHDNNTTLGWFSSLPDEHRQQLARYTSQATEPMPWLLIDMALASVGNMAVIPLQDLLALDGDHRMNIPGTMDKNWIWTFDWNQVDNGLAGRIRDRLRLYDRLGKS